MPCGDNFTTICFSSPVSGSTGSVASSTSPLMLDVYRPVIGRIGAHRILGSGPDAVSAARHPGRLAGFAQGLREFLEEVLAAHKCIAHDARANNAGNDQLDFSIGNAVAVRPALVAGLLDLDGGCGAHAQQ